MCVTKDKTNVIKDRDIIADVVKAARIKQKEAKIVLDTLKELIREDILAHRKVLIWGFGSFISKPHTKRMFGNHGWRNRPKQKSSHNITFVAGPKFDAQLRGKDYRDNPAYKELKERRRKYGNHQVDFKGRAHTKTERSTKTAAWWTTKWGMAELRKKAEAEAKLSKKKKNK